MSEKDEKEKRTPFERLIDKVEDAVENVVDPDARERRHSHQHRHYEDERTHITINVNVECCPPSSSPGTGTGTPTGRPTHQTGTSDGSVNGGLGAPGGVIKIPGRPGTVWPGPRTQLYLPFLFIRATAGDTAARPVVGTFWESPD